MKPFEAFCVLYKGEFERWCSDEEIAINTAKRLNEPIGRQRGGYRFVRVLVTEISK